MTFCIALMSEIAHAIAGPEAARKDSLFEGILLTSMLFEEVSKNDSLAVFATVGGLGDNVRKYVIQELAAAVTSHWAKVFGAAVGRYAGLTPSVLQPYVTASLTPNIVSPFHLACQAICTEYVTPLTALS
jgi:hypothetical protein